MKLSFTRTCVSICCLGSLIFFFFRGLQLYVYGDKTIFQLYSADLSQAFLMGGRFDVKIMAIICLAIWMPVFLISTWISSSRVKWALQKTVLFLIFSSVILIAVSQYYFYSFYKSPFNTLAWGLMDEDINGVWVSIWDSYPVLWVALGLLVVPLLFILLTKHVSKQSVKNKKNVYLQSLKVICCLVMLGICARGSFGGFPLRLQDITISSNPFINDLIGNGFQTIYTAYHERADQATISKNTASELPRFGFSSLDDLAKALGAVSGSDKDLTDFILHNTPKNDYLDQHPPHVIFVLMESWGAHQLRYTSEATNLTGALAKYLEKDYSFENFFSSHIGTHPSLESLLVNSPITPLTLGTNGAIQYKSAAVKPFKDRGYKTIFIYGGSNGWRSLNKSLPNLYFDAVYDMANIREKYPEAEGNAWGIFDEYLLRFAYDVLQENNEKGEKVFLFILNTTNHPPFNLPSTYKQLPLDLTEINKVALNDPEVTHKMAATYQYANDQLGLFIDQIKGSSFGEKSIIAAAGDHSLRTFFKYDQSETKDLYRIGCLFCVPDAYKTSFSPKLNRYASHRDIFPSLYHLSLSQAQYVKFGESLFAPIASENEYAMVMYNILFAPEGVIFSYPTSNPSAISWRDAIQRYTSPDVPVAAELMAKGTKARALTALMDWYIRYQINTEPS